MDKYSSILINAHHFSEDSVYGELVKKFSNGILTNKDIDLINTRLLNNGCGNGGKLESSGDTSVICYTCRNDNERNSITTSIVRKLIKETHPIADNDDCIS